MSEKKAWTDFNLNVADYLERCNMNEIIKDLTSYLKESFEDKHSAWREGIWMPPFTQ